MHEKLSIAVLGSTGVYGRHLLPRLVARGYRVRALARSPASATIARACGVETRSADIFDEASLRAGLIGSDVAINLATSLPSPSSPKGDYAANDELRRRGTEIWVRACRDAGVSRVLQQSIAMTHAGGGDELADENTLHTLETNSVAGAAIAAVREMETIVANSTSDWLVLRGALFYGPGTGFDDDWFARARAGKLRLPADGSDYVSLIHIADMAAATVEAIERWPSRTSLIVSDNEPVRWADLLSYVCVLAGSAPPSAGGRALMPSLRVANARARELLSWSPMYPNYRIGLVR